MTNIYLTIFFTIVCSIPILGWIFFFQKRNCENKKYVCLTFAAGMLSVLPIKLYEKYWNTAVLYFENINLFKHISSLLHIPSFSKLLAFISVNAIVATILFLFAAFLMFILEVFSRDNTVRTFEKKTTKILECPLFFISVGVLCGILAYFFSFTMPQKVWFFIIIGMLEEYIKHLVLRFADDDKINSIDDAISFSIIVALGFAFVENILYLQNFWNAGFYSIVQFIIFVALRSSISVIAHVCFSAILGYFYGIAHFAKIIYKQEVQERKHPFLVFLHKILHLKASTLFHEEKMMEGMIVAMGIHAAFNSLLEFGKINILVPSLLFLFFITLNLFHRKKLHLEVGNMHHQTVVVAQS